VPVSNESVQLYFTSSDSVAEVVEGTVAFKAGDVGGGVETVGGEI
jgi:hypothetical protein